MGDKILHIKSKCDDGKRVGETIPHREVTVGASHGIGSREYISVAAHRKETSRLRRMTTVTVSGTYQCALSGLIGNGKATEVVPRRNPSSGIFQPKDFFVSSADEKGLHYGNHRTS